MEYHIIVFKSFGGLAVFLYGMNLMSDGLKKISSESFKRVLRTLTKNRPAAILVGLVITCSIQSSSATSVMVVGFINAGLLAFQQGVAVVLGADIGTTITAWIVSALGIGEFKIVSFSLPIIGLGFIINFVAKRRKPKMIGQVLLGFGFLFLGLGTMADGVGPIKNSKMITDFFATCAENPFLGILAGTVVTVIIQSSSATIAILQVMASHGIISLDAALPIMLGDNIGTTITAQLAAIGGTKAARGVAMANSLFKIFGTAIFTPLLLLGIYQAGIRFLIPDSAVSISGANSTIMMQIAVAHSAFNIINTIIFSSAMWPVLIGSAKKLSFGKGSFDDADVDRRYLDPLLLENPPTAIEQCVSELAYMTKIAKKNIIAGFAAFMENNLKDSTEIRRREEIIDKLQHQTTAFLVQLTRLDLSEEDSYAIPRLIHCINDAERIGDHAENLLELTELKINNKIVFSQEVVDEIQKFFKLVEDHCNIVLKALDIKKPEIIEEAMKSEKKIDAAFEMLSHANIGKLDVDKTGGVLSGVVFFDLIANLERIADHLTNIAERVEISDI